MIESYHGHLKMDYLWTAPLRPYAETRGHLATSLRHYNEERPHSSELSHANGVREEDEGGSMTGAGPMAEPPSPRTPHPVQTGGVHVTMFSPIFRLIAKKLPSMPGNRRPYLFCSAHHLYPGA